MQKPIKEWLEELPEPYRSQALEYVDSGTILTSPKYEPTTLTAAVCSIYWNGTKEGFGYWSDFANTLK